MLGCTRTGQVLFVAMAFSTCMKGLALKHDLLSSLSSLCSAFKAWAQTVNMCFVNFLHPLSVKDISLEVLFLGKSLFTLRFAVDLDVDLDLLAIFFELFCRFIKVVSPTR